MLRVHVARSAVIFALTLLMPCLAAAWRPYEAYAAGGGTGSFSDGGYAMPGIYYYYNVNGAPPLKCGTLSLRRNGVLETTPGWICTDVNGNATKGPWTATANETAEDIQIIWPGGLSTIDGYFHYNDVSPPSLQVPPGGTGVPWVFGGSASDARWGTGFNVTPTGWTYMYASFYDYTANAYYNGASYSGGYVDFDGAVSPARAMNVNWQVATPPASSHLRSHTYIWCATISDYFYFETKCTTYANPSNGR